MLDKYAVERRYRILEINENCCHLRAHYELIRIFKNAGYGEQTEGRQCPGIRVCLIFKDPCGLSL